MTEKPRDQEPTANDSGQESNGQEYITREQFDAFTAELQEGLGKNYRAVQSKTDSYQAQVQNAIKQFEQSLDTMKSMGIEVSPQQAEQGRQKAMLDALAGSPETTEQAPGQGPSEDQEADSDPIIQTVNNVVAGMQQAAGVEIFEDDPEAEMIVNASDGEPYDFINAFQQAITAKQQRLAEQGGAGEVNPARITGLTTGGKPAANALEGVIDPDELFKRAKQAGKI